jgi:hypothetical protein
MTVSLDLGDGCRKAGAILLQRKVHINRGATQKTRDLTKLQTHS